MKFSDFKLIAGALLVYIMAACCLSASAQNTKTVASTLEEATVFLNKAQLTNLASVSIENGLTSLTITGLPGHIDQQSLTVEAKGNALLQGVQFQNNFQKAGSKPVHIRKLEDSLEYYRDRQRIHSDQRDILTKEEALLMANQSVKGDDGLEVLMLEEMADFFRQRMTKIRLLILQEDKVIKTLARRIEAVSRQLNEFNNNPNQPTGEVLLTISATQRASIDFTITYVVANAGWAPLYDLRATDTNSPVKLVYKANVRQQTGLDWKRVKLKLTSGNPAAGATKPNLNTWYLRPLQPANPAASSQNRDTKLQLLSGANRKEAATETMADYVVVNESMLSVEFNINLPYTIPSDGKPHPIELQQHDLKAQYQHMAVPKLDARAFLVARVTGWDEYNLLPGKVNTYFAGTFVGETFLDANTTSDTLSISLGVDKNVIVTREKVKDYKGKSFFGGSTKETTGYQISIRNAKTTPVEILIEDQMPVSANSQISVEAQELSGGKLDPATGKVTWNIKLNPNETKKLNLKFEVKYPKEMRLTGL